MDLEQLKQLLDLVREHELAEFEIEHEGLRVKIRKDGTGASVVALPAPPVPGVGLPAASTMASIATSATGATGPAGAGPSPATSEPGAAGASGDAAAAGVDTEIELAVVKSPIVGTFYRSPEPGASSFVEIGSTVKKGQVLCIIEAMKLMNEIDSEYDGEVVNIYVDNGQPVQYGERLFAIRTK